MSQFMRQQLLALGGVRSVAVLAENDIGAEGIGLRSGFRSAAMRLIIVMDTDILKTRVEAGLHVAAYTRVKRGAAD
ncbi:MAG TPA: hypothetical protein VGM72_07555 [Micropepsaceae bacterium]